MEMKSGLPVLAFADLAAWEAWLADRPRDAIGLWLKLAKAGNTASALTKAQAIDGALCHGWIDGQIDRYDETWFLTRFTPRAAKSKWSEKNRQRVAQLMTEGRVAAAAHAAVEAAKADGRWNAAYAPASTATEPGGPRLLRRTDRRQPLRHFLPRPRRQEARNQSRADRQIRRNVRGARNAALKVPGNRH